WANCCAPFVRGAGHVQAVGGFSCELVQSVANCREDLQERRGQTRLRYRPRTASCPHHLAHRKAWLKRPTSLWILPAEISSNSLLKNLEMESFRILAGGCWGDAVELDVIF